MTWLDVWLLALSLAMDCFTVAVAAGVIQRQVRLQTLGLMALLFGTFQGGMTLLGWLGVSYLYEVIASFDHWIAFSLLALLGVRMIYDGMKKEEGEHHFDPSSVGVVLLLAVATSIDALAVGMSFPCVGMNRLAQVFAPALVVGLVSFAMTVLGYLLGVLFGRRFNLPVEPLGGLILILIGCRILYEHLYL